MNDSNRTASRLGELLRTNRLAIALEIAIVFLPVSLGLIINDRVGADYISLSGSLKLKGGPIVYLGLAVCMALLWGASWLRGARWSDFGLRRQKNWLVTILLGLGAALAVFAAVKFAIQPLMSALPNVPPRDMSAFKIMTGHLLNLILNVLAMWVTAAFLEEFLWRGYLLERLIDAIGRRTWLTWAVSLVVSAVVFGLPHFAQGPIGILRTGAIGLVLGLCYLAVGRNLWPLILAHGLIDTLDFVGHYFG